MIRRRKILLHTLILSSYLAFVGSMLISARSFYAGKPVELGDAVISYLLSASDNPHGYRIANAGISLCGALLLPVAFLFYRALSRRNRSLALAGSLAFGLGPLSAAFMIFFTPEINDLHGYLATAAYFFMTSGLLASLSLEGESIVRAGGFRGMALLLVLLFLIAILTFLVYLLFAPDFFDGKSLLRNVAFDEWSLCSVVAACISGLAVMLTRPTR
jgi:hypothetical protein